jgi:predicted ABC-type transport system involved in lysophospholipase L1 biosynthesis ATPase subunit
VVQQFNQALLQSSSNHAEKTTLIGGLDFPYIGKVIIPTDELHHFSEEKSQHVGKKNIHWVGLQ